MNTQPSEKRISSVDIDHPIQVHSIFHTIQGEGPYSGRRALFIRLAGCNLQCPGCDTDYTSERINFHPADLMTSVRNHTKGRKGLVVITGGEPFRQPIGPLVNALNIEGYKTQIETNGTYPPPHGFPPTDTVVVVSPKTGRVHPKTVERANHWKYVLHHQFINPKDGLPVIALGHTAHPQLARPPRGASVYVQPEDCGDDTVNTKNLEAARESCLEFGYILQVQLHKLVGVP